MVCHAAILLKGDTLVVVGCISDVIIAQGLLVVGGVYAIHIFTGWACPIFYSLNHGMDNLYE